MTTNIIEGIQAECRRVREQLVPAYEEIGPVGAFGKAMILAAVQEGEAAIASGDTIRMMQALVALRECE